MAAMIRGPGGPLLTLSVEPAPADSSQNGV